MPSEQIDPLEEKAIEKGSAWADEQMLLIPAHLASTIITRQEYRDVLAMAYAKGFKDAKLEHLH